ncbi:hypothetical protein [Streptomyces sp. NPDC054783]
MPAIPGRLAGHEARLYASLASWLSRRARGTAGGRAFGYTRGQGATMAGLAFVCVVETVGVSAMPRGMPTSHDVLLVLDLHTVLFVVGLHAACVVRPHVLTPEALRVRYGVHVDLRIPLDVISAVRRAPCAGTRGACTLRRTKRSNSPSPSPTCPSSAGRAR